MANKRKTAVEKRDSAPAPVVQVLQEQKGRNYPKGSMLIASPNAIGAIVSRIPQGRVMTIELLRERLAAGFRADYTCPLTTGIFLRVLAEAAEEEGSTATCPYWRIVRPDGRLIDKLPGGEAAQAERLAADGVPCQRAGSGWKVAVLAEHLWRG